MSEPGDASPTAQKDAVRAQRLAALRPVVEGRSIAVGVCAGIASYKVCSVVSALAQCGASVTVAMTTDAQRFVTPLVFQSLSGRAVIGSPWESASPADPQHIKVAVGLDLYLVAPCTMDMLARLATGRCDDAVSLLAASIDRARTPVLLAPSMNEAMWRQPATERNLATLRADGFTVVEPACGWQACRSVGPGRLPEPEDLLDAVAETLRGRTVR
jgi:phosphopantothenoylcysteine decarboxylase/phosphopantothenate--cysteine ligase